MNQSAAVHARIDPATKAATEKIVNSLGMTPTEVIRLFYRQICHQEVVSLRITCAQQVDRFRTLEER